MNRQDTLRASAESHCVFVFNGAGNKAGHSLSFFSLVVSKMPRKTSKTQRIFLPSRTLKKFLENKQNTLKKPRKIPARKTPRKEKHNKEKQDRVLSPRPNPPNPWKKGKESSGESNMHQIVATGKKNPPFLWEILLFLQDLLSESLFSLTGRPSIRWQEVPFSWMPPEGVQPTVVVLPSSQIYPPFRKHCARETIIEELFSEGLREIVTIDCMI